jgi:transcriptional regulator with XRE-family HTH domain
MKRLNLNKIDRLREEKGWSRNELARRSGMSGGGLSLMFKEERAPTLATALGIAEALEVSLYELLEEDCEDCEERAVA